MTADRWKGPATTDPRAFPYMTADDGNPPPFTSADRVIEFAELHLATPLDEWQRTVIRAALDADPDVVRRALLARPRPARP